MDISLIPADQPVAVMAGLFGIAAAGFLLEKTKIGALLTGTVWAILIAILATNLRVPVGTTETGEQIWMGVMPFSSSAYDFVFRYAVPVLIPLFLMKADLRRILFETTRMTGAFAICCVATLFGVFAAVFVVDLGAQEAAVAASLTGSYTGGTVNFVPLTQMTGLSEDGALVAAIVAADHLASASWVAVMAMLPGLAWLARRYVPRDHTQGEIEEAGEGGGRATSLSLALTLTYALVVVALGDALVRAGAYAFETWWGLGPDDLRAAIGVSIGDLRYVAITMLALILPTVVPGQMARLHGGFELGVVFAFMFFAAIAAESNIAMLLEAAPLIGLFIFVLVSVHAVVALVLAKFARLSLPEILIASNAAILGATTAPALAAAKGWRDLVTPGVLMGVLGYAVGTVLGTTVFGLLN
ncbi:MAG: DUF819 family protein [Oceanicaulis sp.]